MDLSECPSWLKDSSKCQSERVGWSIRIFPSDTLGFLKNTIKEESEQALKDSWEISSLGRAERAKKARFLHLVKEKRNLGEILSEEEEKVLHLPLRERKKSVPNFDEFIPKLNDKDKNKKVDKKDKEKEKQVEPILNPEYNLNLDKLNLPIADQHTSKNLKEFLHYCHSERQLIKQKASENSKITYCNY